MKRCLLCNDRIDGDYDFCAICQFAYNVNQKIINAYDKDIVINNQKVSWEEYSIAHGFIRNFKELKCKQNKKSFLDIFKIKQNGSVTI